MQNRFDMFDTGYGDRVHFLNLYQHLKKLGVDVDYSLELTPDVSGYDLIHLFNISRSDTYFQMQHAKKFNKNVVLTPINISVKLVADLAQRQGCGAGDRLAALVKKNRLMREMALAIKFRRPAHRRVKSLEYDTNKLFNAQKQILQNIDYMCPGSAAEARIIQESFGLLPPYKVVHVGIDNFFTLATPDVFLSKYGFSDFVLCVGLVSPLKNQLALIKALQGSGLKLVIAGAFGKPATYIRKCRDAAQQGDVVFLGHVDRALLASAYAAAKVHVLPSFSETTGRATFEAALAGATIVVSDIPVHREYCRDFVEYCDPLAIDSIRSAILKAFAKSRTPDFAAFIQKNYSWEKMAHTVAGVYEKVLSKKLALSKVGVM
ncbi:glycosyltransferase [candidate division KSB1 bacterium]|nr:glycosyltransferase [candidate division KSB1 bacterium]